jgi:hypothetical protein
LGYYADPSKETLDFRRLIAENGAMTRRRLLLLGLLVSLIALGAGTWLFLPRTAITRENAEKIQKGMKLAEVEAILGGPERDESTGRLEQDGSDDDPARKYVDAVIGKRKNWRSDRVIIDVYMDAAGRVQVCYRLKVRRMHESPVAVFRRWLHL